MVSCSLFVGGNADGFSVYCYRQADVVSNNAVFVGGNANGFDVDCHEQADIVTSYNSYLDGNADIADLIIYPNPGNGIFNIIFNSKPQQTYSIEVLNILSESMFNSNKFQSSINLSDKPSGVYFLHLSFDSKTIIKKIVINR